MNSNSRKTTLTSSRARRGFTMIELMCVIAIIGLMATLTMSMGPGLLNANRFTQNILTLSGTMEMSRQHAITNNTYVWVAFTDTSPEGVYVACFESKEGTDGLNWDTGSKKLSTFPNLTLLRKTQLISNLSLQDATTLSVSGLPSTTGTVNPMQSIKVIIPVAGVDKTFTKAVQFTPTGEAKVLAKSNFVQLGIAPSTVSTSNKNVAILRLAGITGKLTVYRAN